VLAAAAGAAAGRRRRDGRLGFGIRRGGRGEERMEKWVEIKPPE